MEYNNSVDSTTITGTASADTITNSGDTVRIDSDKGDDEIFNEGVNVSINAGKGDDEVTNIADSVTICGDKGDDEIYNDGAFVSINAGKGDDLIEIINGSVGRNEILINLTSGTLDETVEDSNGDIILKVGSGSIRLNDLYHEGVTLRDALGNLTVVKDIQGAHASYNSLDSVLFSGDYDENELLNHGTNVTIKGGSGNDHIHNNFTDNVTVDAGTGDDYIFSEGSNQRNVNSAN